MTLLEMRAALVQKVETAWKEYQAQMLACSVEQVFARADEVAATKFCRDYLTGFPENLHGDDLEYLLHFENPLEVMRDLWLSAQDCDPSEELSHALWDTRDRGEVEQTYEIDPDWVSQEEGGQMLC